MDPIIKIIDTKFNRCGNLLRAQTIIKHFKKEKIHPGHHSAFKLMSTTFTILERLKELDEQIHGLNKSAPLSPDMCNKRDLLQIIKDDLIDQIAGSIQTLEKSTHFFTTDSDLLSVADDLEKATDIFVRKMRERKLRKLTRDVLEF